jgi:hypothetical protein
MVERLNEAADHHERSVMRVYVAVADGPGGGEVLLTTFTDLNDERMPVSAVEGGLEKLRELAQFMADRKQTPVSIICFTGRTLHDTLFPTATGDKTS